MTKPKTSAKTSAEMMRETTKRFEMASACGDRGLKGELVSILYPYAVAPYQGILGRSVARVAIETSRASLPRRLRHSAEPHLDHFAYTILKNRLEDLQASLLAAGQRLGELQCLARRNLAGHRRLIWIDHGLDNRRDAPVP